MADRNTSDGTDSMALLPKNPAKYRVTMVMLMIWPSTRMVAAEPEARPYWFLATELMMVFILGDEKKAKPNPTQTSRPIMIPRGVAIDRKVKAAKPKVHMVIPRVVRYRG
ncbi:MAG: hypothetical protein A2067_01525 [Deltaproteobacteria bacterium GWB2_42_7]|nr:MAG: hypothetical protein A2067_01525 [Deltaproteobacteria bacterium GWB2_42_7]